MASMNESAALFGNLSQMLAPHNFVRTLQGAQQYNARQRQLQSMEDGIKDLNFRATKDPALKKRINSAKTMFPNAMASPEEFQRFSSHIAEVGMMEDTLDEVANNELFAGDPMIETYRKLAQTRPTEAASRLTNYMQSQQLFYTRQQEQEAMRQKKIEAEAAGALKLENLLDQFGTDLGEGETVRSRILDSGDLTDQEKIKAILMSEADQARELQIQRQEETLPSAQLAVQEKLMSEANDIVSNLPEGVESTEAMELIARSEGSEAAKQIAVGTILKRAAEGRAVGAEARAEASASASNAEKILRGIAAQQEVRLEEEKLEKEELAARSELEQDLRSVQDVLGLDDATMADADLLRDALTGQDLTLSEEKIGSKPEALVDFVRKEGLRVAEANVDSIQSSIASSQLLSSRGDLIQKQDTGDVKGRGAQKEAIMRDILVPSNQFKNAAVISNTDIQTATKDSDLDGLPNIQNRFVIMDDDGNHPAIKAPDGNIYGFVNRAGAGVRPEIYQYGENDQGNLVKGALVKPADFNSNVTLETIHAYGDDSPKQVRKSLDRFSKFLSENYADDPEARQIISELKNTKANLLTTGSDDEKKVAAGLAMAKFIPLRMRWDSKLTNAYKFNQPEE